jgi:hypothetical protein
LARAGHVLPWSRFTEWRRLQKTPYRKGYSQERGATLAERSNFHFFESLLLLLLQQQRYGAPLTATMAPSPQSLQYFGQLNASSSRFCRGDGRMASAGFGVHCQAHLERWEGPQQDSKRGSATVTTRQRSSGFSTLAKSRTVWTRETPLG